MKNNLLLLIFTISQIVSFAEDDKTDKILEDLSVKQNHIIIWM